MPLKSIELPYGREKLTITIDESTFEVDVLSAEEPAALFNAKASFDEAVTNPVESISLCELGAKLSAKSKVAIVIADHTRPVPDKYLVPWIVEALGVSDEQILLLIGTGTHRASTQQELLEMLGAENLSRFKVINHDCLNQAELRLAGISELNEEVWLNRHYVEADLRIATGFIEPHFFAGFSGGCKAVVPGIAGFKTIQYFHSSKLISNPNTVMGKLSDNPLQAMTRRMLRQCPIDFIVNVSLNSEKQITGIFAGHREGAHDVGSEKVRVDTTIQVDQTYPIVITTNGGYPLDQNFYQTIKGLATASRITAQGGKIILVSRCDQGLPSEGHFFEILNEALSDDDLLSEILALEVDETKQDQWQVQTLLQCLQKHDVYHYSELSEGDQSVTRVKRILNVNELLRSFATNERQKIGVLVEGPLHLPELLDVQSDGRDLI